jgi:hypothetical protein
MIGVTIGAVVIQAATVSGTEGFNAAFGVG